MIVSLSEFVICVYQGFPIRGRVFTTADFDEEGALVIKKGKKGFHQIKAAE